MPRQPGPAHGTVFFMPLGGLGQIGMNCFALEQDGALLLVDYGAGFPEDDIGEDLIVVDLSWLESRRRDIAGLFITHGHEDHIGGVPHFVRTLGTKIPIYAPAHAAALMAARLREQGLSDEMIHLVALGNCYEVGPFVIEPIAVAHSIVDATALCITTKVGRIVHTADFDLDREQPVGHRTDEERFAQLGREGVRLLLSDSTNIESEARTADEAKVAVELGRLVEEAAGRVVVGMFSSNVHRIAALLRAAQQTQRKLCLLGRSLRRHFEIAEALGYLRYPSHLLVAPEDVDDLPPEKTLVIAGGSQGEAVSALRKLSQSAHPHLGLTAGDRVILSCRVIPGNERRVFSMINDFTRQDVEVLTKSSHPLVHVSGHASRNELGQMIDWVRPCSFVPVHGTLMHMKAHARLAEKLGIEDRLVVENGTRIAITEHGPLQVAGRVPASVTRLVAGGAELDGATRRKRFSLARNGVISISFQIDADEHLIGRPRVSSRGVVGVDAHDGAVNVIVESVARTIESARKMRMRSLEATVTDAVRSVVAEMCGVRPMVVVHALSARSRAVASGMKKSEA